MSTTRGYYSIIQYCPDPSRLEAVNVGVALFCPDLPYLEARFKRRKTPIQELFGVQEWDFVEAQQEALEARLKLREEEFGDLERFEQFVAKRAGAFRLTAPRFVKVEDPAKEMKSLFARLVGSQGKPKPESAKLMEVELGNRFQSEGVADRLQSEVTVEPPTLPKPFKVPFAYRNGRLNLIEPVQFEGRTAESVFNRASIHAVEGQFLEEYRDPKFGALELIVVGKFGPDQGQAEETARAVFKHHGVKMHTFGNLEPLIAEIRQLAHR